MSALRRICLVGVSGLGKTTLLRDLAPRLPFYRCLTGSALLRELAGAEFARFDHLDPARKQHFRAQAIVRMAQIQAEAGLHLLCEGHTTLRSRHSGQVEPVFTAQDRGFFRELILLSADVALVVARRQGDATRQRVATPEAVAEELAAERAECERVATDAGMRLSELDAGAADLAERLLALLEAP